MNSQGQRIAAVLLAAGNASRFGAAKQTLAIEGIPMVRRAAMTALHAGLSPVVVVIGAYADAVRPCLAGLPVQVVENPDWTTGMGGSLGLGVRTAVAREAAPDALVVLLADQPGIRAAHLKGMIEAHATAPGHIHAAQFNGHLGPPCLFPRDYFEELASLQGQKGAQRLIERYFDCVDVHDLPAAAFDIDTPGDHAVWLAHQGID
ncbi:nucleotidyltransferase family protein [Dyella halodurans]|uniref:NTP transferase domain-containing protein n=1 Tax=Dyella halodurans TaxID=1920171 RepID=A0ABV9C304_9GAMM|nr:nucleotidyltransferase family protein [Dyella halodurans]